MTANPDKTPSIYVSCLAAYNAGFHHGTGWIEATNAEEVWEKIYEMMRKSPTPNVLVDCPECDANGCNACKGQGKVHSSEEWMISDSECFGGYSVGEYSDIDEICKVGALIVERGDAFRAALAVYDSVEEAITGLEEGYRGVHDSDANCAEEWAAEVECEYLSEMPDHLKDCIDWQRYANNQMNLRFVRVGGDRHYFSL